MEHGNQSDKENKNKLEEIETITKEKEKEKISEITSHSVRKDKADVKRTHKKIITWIGGVMCPVKRRALFLKNFGQEWVVYNVRIGNTKWDMFG